MKHLASILFFFIFFFFLPQRVEAAISSISATAVITSCPQLLSGGDRCEADLYAMTTDGSTETFSATYGIDFRTGSPPGVLTYLWNASPYNTGTITVGPSSTYLGSFYTMVNNGTGTCALNEGQVHARPRIDEVCTLCFSPDSYGITNIGAMVHIDVYQSSGAVANGASVSISPGDYSAGSGTTSGGRVTFQNINCTVGHTVNASWNGQTGSLWLPAQPGGGAAGPCNGTARSFSITLSPPTPPPGAPSAGGSTTAYCPSAGSSTGSMDIYWSGGSSATSHRINYGVGCDAHADACPYDVTLTSSPQTINGFTLGNTINWEIFACNAGGCTPTDLGYYQRTFPASCTGAAPTPTPTPPAGSTACPNFPSSPAGSQNFCEAGSCSPGRSIYGSASNNDCGPGFVCCNQPAPTPTPTVADPNCPVTDLDGHTNQCANSCPAGTAPKSAGANAACQAFNGTQYCCHPIHPPAETTYTGSYTGSYTTTYTGTYTTTYTGSYTWCGDNICNGFESASDCDDCKVTIQGSLLEDVNGRDGAGILIPYTGTTVSLSGAAARSTTSNSSYPYNFIFANRTATNDTYSLDFALPAGYELVTAASSPKPRSNFVISSGSDPDLTNTRWIIQEINECDDGIDNDGDGGTDCTPGGCPPGQTCDSACWPVSGNPYDTDASQCCTDPPCQEEPPGGTECSDSIDNTDLEDTYIDGQDPGCHTDGNASNRASYDPNDDSETDVPICDTLSASPNPINANGQVTLTLANCRNVTPTITPTTTPPIEWSPTPVDPPGDGHDCSDASDNDGDSTIDATDPGCHTDGNPNNPGSYNPTDDDETNGGGGGGSPECSDGADNDTDGFIDTTDPGCHSDGNPSNPGTYDPNDDNESSVPYPECSDGIDNSDPDSLVDYLDPECHTDGDTSNPDTYNPDDPSESSPANSCSDASISNTSNSANYTSASSTWTAPACPGNSGLTCPVTVTVNGRGGSTDLSFGNITVNPTYNITARVNEDTNYNGCTSGSTPYPGNVQVGLTRTSPVPQQSTTRTMSGGSEVFACQLPGNYEVSIATPNGYRGVGATISGGAGSSVSTNQFNFTVSNQNPTITFCITNLAPWIQTDKGDVRFNTIDNPVPPGESASLDATSPSILFSSSGDGDIGLGSVSPNGDKEWIVDQEYNYNKNMKSVNGAAAYTFYKARVKQRNITLNTLNLGATGNVAPSTTGIYEIAGDANGDFTLTGYTHPSVSGSPGRVVLLVPGDLTISSNISVPTGGLLIVAVQGSITVAETVGDLPANYSSTTAHLNGIFTAEGSIMIPGNLCADGTTQDRKLNVAGSLVANARKPFAEGPGGGIVDNQRSLCQSDADYASVTVTTRADFLLQLTDFYKTTYSRWKEVRPE